MLALLVTASAASAGNMALYLDVSINGIPTNKLAAFTLRDDGRIEATPAELVDIGLVVPGDLAAAPAVDLDQLAGATYRYDEPAQTIDITIADTQRQAQSFDLASTTTEPSQGAAGSLSAAFNYDLAVHSGNVLGAAWWQGLAANASLQAKLFTPAGRLTQSGLLDLQPSGNVALVRLDTSFSRSDPVQGLAYKLGDMVAAGLPWTRPVRLAGAGIQNNFSARPDLLTTTAFALRGTASVPSTMDVFVNDTRVFTASVAPGPFDVANVPMNAGPGVARLVLTDANGKTSQTRVPYYASARLLKPSLAQWSVEAGFPRFNYGTSSDTYGIQPLLIASARYGVSDALTLEGHAEAGAGVVNGGIGTVSTIGSVGVLSRSIAISTGDRGWGGQVNIGAETALGDWTLSGAALRSFGAYDDLADATARQQFPTDLGYGYSQGSALASERVSLSTPELGQHGGMLNVQLLHSASLAGDHSSIASLSYAQSIGYGGTLYASAFHDVSNSSTGFTLGLSMPLGADISTSTYASSAGGTNILVAEASKPLGLMPGDIGWRLRTSQFGVSQTEAGVGYRHGGGTAQLSLAQAGSDLSASLQLRGALAWAADSLFVSDQIGDAFVVVDAGHPDVAVLYENQPVGSTGSNGKILVPTMAAFESRRLSIDPTNLPADVEIGAPSQVVTPGDAGGVVVRFDVAKTATAALVDLVDASGTPIAAGVSGTTGNGEPFLVGYDGQAYLHNLLPANDFTLTLPAGEVCRGQFPYQPAAGTQVHIGPVTCS